MCPWSFKWLTSIVFFSQLAYSLSILIVILIYNFYQLHVLILTLRTHDIIHIQGNECYVGFKKFLHARKKKIMKWVFQTIAKDRDWIISSLVCCSRVKILCFPIIHREKNFCSRKWWHPLPAPTLPMAL